METLQIGRAKLTWLRGGVTHLDGGAMFGVVPKPLWSRTYPYDEKNRVELRTDPILLQIDGKHILIDTGLGNHKFTEKQLRNFGVLEQSSVRESLTKLGLTVQDIDFVLMTHLHFDHACGLTEKNEEGNYHSIFKQADIIVSDIEWHEMMYPNIRSVNTYWKMNWEPITNQVKTFKKEIEIVQGLRMIHTGGHSEGHAIIVFEDGEECWVHMADLMATHAHQPVLWAMAYDDYPVTSVHQKEKWMTYGYEKNAWFTFYHDAYYRALRFDASGQKVDSIKRQR